MDVFNKTVCTVPTEKFYLPWIPQIDGPPLYSSPYTTLYLDLVSCTALSGVLTATGIPNSGGDIVPMPAIPGGIVLTQLSYIYDATSGAPNSDIYQSSQPLSSKPTKTESTPLRPGPSPQPPEPQRTIPAVSSVSSYREGPQSGYSACDRADFDGEEVPSIDSSFLHSASSISLVSQPYTHISAFLGRVSDVKHLPSSATTSISFNLHPDQIAPVPGILPLSTRHSVSSAIIDFSSAPLDENNMVVDFGQSTATVDFSATSTFKMSPKTLVHSGDHSSSTTTNVASTSQKAGLGGPSMVFESSGSSRVGGFPKKLILCGLLMLLASIVV